MKKKIFLITAALLNTSLIFAQKNFFYATEFTKEGEFTSNCEGPSVDKAGNVYAVNINQDGTIVRIAPDSKTSFFLTLPNDSVGNGIRFDSGNTFFVADFMQHNVLKVDLNTK